MGFEGPMGIFSLLEETHVEELLLALRECLAELAARGLAPETALQLMAKFNQIDPLRPPQPATEGK